MLATRYFGMDSGVSTLFPIIEILEEVVGRQEMEDMYFKADLHGFLGKIQEYSVSAEETLNIMKTFDDCFYKAGNSEADMDEQTKRIMGLHKMVFDIYFNKYNVKDGERVDFFKSKCDESYGKLFVIDQFDVEGRKKIQEQIILLVDRTTNEYIQKIDVKVASSKVG